MSIHISILGTSRRDIIKSWSFYTQTLLYWLMTMYSVIFNFQFQFPSKYCLHNGTVGRRQTVISSVLSCFGGGVILATTLLHMLPEVIEGLAEEAASLELEFLPQLVFCSGFFLIYMVEELAEALLGGHNEAETLHRTVSIRRSSRASCKERF